MSFITDGPPKDQKLYTPEEKQQQQKVGNLIGDPIAGWDAPFDQSLLVFSSNHIF